ncbi:MAG: molybdopterin-binding protein [Gemmatimonadetes bacterium]|nr:molybdopterin-binding protein [Gemmatimonadota bacterium]
MTDEQPIVEGAEASDGVTRRQLLTGAAALVGGAVLAGLPGSAAGQGKEAPARPVAPPDPTKLQGAPTSAVGTRSPFVTPARTPTGQTVGNSLTPLQDLTGTITPSDLHFERHHAGVPMIDPERHELIIHGLVERPTVFTLEDLKRFPSVTRQHFIECSGNGRASYRDPKPDMTPQKVYGLTANSEWTGVPVAQLFREVGVRPEATWFLAEGGDACLMNRSVPVAKGWDDALVVWAQNGEPIRPEQGFPLRLLLPGYEGNINVKWLRRLELGTAPWMTRWETSKYTDVLADGTAREFSLVMDAGSIITSPAFPRVLKDKGWWPITGLAWTGRGRIARVEVSTDGGKNWSEAELHGPVLPNAHTRFSMMWEWDGRETVLLSRAIDETGYVQPTRKELLAVRSIGTDYHFNQIKGWRVQRDGTIVFEGGDA